MKFILAICFFFFSAGAAAQISRATLDLLMSSMDLLQKSDYKKAIPLFEKGIVAVKKEMGETDPMYIGQLALIGHCHHMLYQFDVAEKYYLQQKELLTKTTGTNDVNYSAAISRLGMLYRDMGKYQQSIELYQHAKTINKTLLGEKSPEYSTMLNNLASLYQSIGQYAKAEQFFIESGNIFKATGGENNALYGANLNNMAVLYNEMAQYEKAEAFCNLGLAIRQNVLGETHPDFAESLNNLASIYLNRGRYNEAEALFIKANSIFKKTLGEASPLYASGLNNLGHFYQNIGKYVKAETIFIDAIAIRKKILGEAHTDYGTSLSNLADLYVYTGQYEKAETIYLQVKEIKQKALGAEHPDYSISLNNLGILYDYLGQYRKAESLYAASIAIKKKIFGEKHPGYALALNNFATLYVSLGQYEKAESFLTQALEIVKAAVGENTSTYALNLDNIANVWQGLEQFTKAEAGYIKAMQIRKAIFGENSIYFAYCLNNLATLYSQLNQYKKAEPLIIQAKDIWKNAMGENTPLYATAVNNLAAFYRKNQTQYAKAETLMLEAIRLRKALLGNSHPDCAISENNLALLYMQTGEYKKAEQLFTSSGNIVLHNIAGNFTILSEKEKGKYLDNNRELIECSNSLLYQYPSASSAFIESNYNLELGLKSLALADTKNMLRQVRGSSDTAVKRIFDQWLALKNIMAKQYTSTGTSGANMKEMEAEAESFEKELNRRSSIFSNQQKLMQVTTKDIQEKLDTDEAAVEFIKFRLYNKKWTDSVIYGAYVLRKNDAAPQFVFLCEKKQLQQLFDSAGNTAPKLVKSFYRGLDVKSREAKLGDKLYKLVWAPLEPFLEGIKKISYSPAGKLYSVAFHALPVDSTSILMDKYQLQQYTSTRQITLRTQDKDEVKPAGITLFGNALFTMDSLQLVKQRKNNTPTIAGSYVSTIRGNENGIWQTLPGTAEEVKKIKQLFNDNRISTTSFVQEAASEENLKALNNTTPQIIHIATHGFFLPESNKKKATTQQRNVYSQADDPLVRTGLVLAGGNYTWGGKQPVDGVEDGIATAYEISQLNLSNTELLVLSACETALGDIKGTEGVFGLQRGFKMAGVKKMIVSLWQVPDKETAELMTTFYSYWMKGKNINDAFTQAQADMRKKYPAYYWAAFVLVE